MTCLLHVSDPHFGTERPEVVEALARLAEQARPDALVLSGDVTQRATRRQFDAARTFVDRLALPHVLVIPGNHDIPLFALWMRAFAPYRRWRRAFGHDLEPVLDLPGCRVVGVNTTRCWRHKHGTLSDEQIERVARRLQAAGDGASPADRLSIVVVHQPVAVPLAKEHNNLLRHRHEALRRWADAGADLVLGGHIHLPYVLPLVDCAGGLPRAMWCVQAGTALSTRVRESAPNSVNLIRNLGWQEVPPGTAAIAATAAATMRRCAVERWDFLDGTFVRVGTHALDLATRGA